MPQLLKGFYYDLLANRKGHAQWESGWRSNLVVSKCHVLLAALMKGQQGVQSILYLAVGSGEDAWDIRRPIPLLTDTRLSSEVARVRLLPDQIVYLDNTNSASKTPLPRLEITAQIRGEDIISHGSQPLREFGLFGGDATGDPDTGFLINRVTHPRIDLTPELTLTRTLRLSFGAGAISQEELTGFGDSLPVISIDGLGSEYASNLEAQGIRFLADLVMIDPLVPVGSIPLVRLREFRAKARMVMRLRVSLAPFAPLAGWNISKLLSEHPDVIAAAAGVEVTPEMATQFQEELAVLQIALDDAQLQNIKLGELLNVS